MVTDLSDFFPQYKGPKQDMQQARNYLASVYQTAFYISDNVSDNRKLYIHFTCATDTENIRIIYDNLKDTVLGANMDELNLVWTFLWEKGVISDSKLKL